MIYVIINILISILLLQGIKNHMSFRNLEMYIKFLIAVCVSAKF